VDSTNNIPKMFTDKAIKDELADVRKSIITKNSELEELKRRISDDQKLLEQQKAHRQEQIDWVKSMPSYIAGLWDADRTAKTFGEIEIRYAGEIKRYNGYISEDKKSCTKLNSEIRELEKRKIDLELLQDTPEEKRAENHYNTLLEKKNNPAVTIDDLAMLVKEFCKMEDYRGSMSLALECRDLATKKAYDFFVREKNNAYTEEQFKNLYKQFKAIDGYADAAELALDCDNKYNELKKVRETHEVQEKERKRQEEERKKREEEDKRREELRRRQEQYDLLVQRMRAASTEEEYKDLAKKFRELDKYKNVVELANKCDAEYNKLSDMRTALHNKKIKNKKIKKCLFIAMLGGIIGGLVFGFLNKVVGVEKEPWVPVTILVAGVLLGIIMLKEGGCWYGCGGFFIGTMLVIVSVGLCAESITTAVIGGVVIGGLVGVVVGGAMVS